MADNERAADSVDAPFPRDGKLSYMQIPAADTKTCGDFYASVFGWRVAAENAGHRSFQDASGELLGAFVSHLTPSAEPGVLPYIYVDGIDAAVERIPAHGGAMVRDIYPEGGLFVATFRDPAGNVIGIWQAGPR